MRSDERVLLFETYQNKGFETARHLHEAEAVRGTLGDAIE